MTKCLSLSREAGRARPLGDLILRYMPVWTPDSVRNLNFKVTSVAWACKIALVENPKHLKGVQQLRRMAYGAAGKADIGAPLSSFVDKHDASAAIVHVRHGPRTVGSLRIVTPAAGASHEYQNIVELPDALARNEDIAAISRICTHPRYRRSDLFCSLLEFADRYVATCGRRYALGGCTPNLLHLYERFGWQSAGVRFCHPQLRNIEEVLIFRDYRRT